MNFSIRIMKKLLIIISLLIYFVSCRENESKEKPITKKGLTVDTSLITILPYDTSLYWVFENCKQAELAEKDLKLIDSLFISCVEDYNKNISIKYPIEKDNCIIDLKKYKRQYIAVANNKGEKEVWINCFCGDWDKDSRLNPVLVMDGGKCYFNLKINLTTKQSYDLMINGEA